VSDIECPYCGSSQEINHDDGYGYEEDEEFEQECSDCDKKFIFTTSISFNYESYCQPEDHVLEPFGEKWPNMYHCVNCEFYERKKDVEP